MSDEMHSKRHAIAQEERKRRLRKVEWWLRSDLGAMTRRKMNEDQLRLDRILAGEEDVAFEEDISSLELNSEDDEDTDTENKDESGTDNKEGATDTGADTDSEEHEKDTEIEKNGRHSDTDEEEACEKVKTDTDSGLPRINSQYHKPNLT